MANVTATFADQVSTLMETKATLHANVSAALDTLKAGLTESLLTRVNNFTTQHKLDVPDTRQAGNNGWLIFNAMLEGIQTSFQGTINATTTAFQQGVQAMQDQVGAVGEFAQEVGANLNSQLNSTLQQFNCAQSLIPQYINIFASSAVRPITCSGDSLSKALTTAWERMDTIQKETDEKVKTAITKYRTCQTAEASDKTKCLPDMLTEMPLITIDSTRALTAFLIKELPDAFRNEQCYEPEAGSATFQTLQEKIQGCAQTTV